METTTERKYQVVVPKSMETRVFGSEGMKTAEDRFVKSSVVTLLIEPCETQYILKSMTGWNSQAVCSADVTKGEILLAGDDLKKVRLTPEVLQM